MPLFIFQVLLTCHRDESIRAVDAPDVICRPALEHCPVVLHGESDAKGLARGALDNLTVSQPGDGGARVATGDGAEREPGRVWGNHGGKSEDNGGLRWNWWRMDRYTV